MDVSSKYLVCDKFIEIEDRKSVGPDWFHARDCYGGVRWMQSWARSQNQLPLMENAKIFLGVYWGLVFNDCLAMCKELNVSLAGNTLRAIRKRGKVHRQLTAIFFHDLQRLQEVCTYIPP